MTDEQQTPALEAGDEAEQVTEATEETGQVESPPEGEESPEEKASPAKARRERRKAEMDRLRSDAQEARKALEAEEARRAKIDEAAKATQPPKEAEFDKYEDYLLAAGAYHAAKAMDGRQVKEVDEAISAQRERIDQIKQQTQQEVAEEWAAQVADAKSRYADFDQVALSVNLPVTETMASVISESDAGADVLYHLGSNPQEAARIARLEPLAAARAIGIIESRLSLPKAKTITETPEPIAPGKSSAAPSSKDPAKMTMAEYRNWRKGKS